MNTARMIIMPLILGLLGQLYAYAGPPLKLEAKRGVLPIPVFRYTNTGLVLPIATSRNMLRRV